MKKRPGIVKYLLEHGALVDLKNKVSLLAVTNKSITLFYLSIICYFGITAWENSY